jgi:hypothetical protein
MPPPAAAGARQAEAEVPVPPVADQRMLVAIPRPVASGGVSIGISGGICAGFEGAWEEGPGVRVGACSAPGTCVDGE